MENQSMPGVERKQNRNKASKKEVASRENQNLHQQHGHIQECINVTDENG